MEWRHRNIKARTGRNPPPSGYSTIWSNKTCSRVSNWNPKQVWWFLLKWNHVRFFIKEAKGASPRDFCLLRSSFILPYESRENLQFHFSRTSNTVGSILKSVCLLNNKATCWGGPPWRGRKVISEFVKKHCAADMNKRYSEMDITLQCSILPTSELVPWHRHKNCLHSFEQRSSPSSKIRCVTSKQSSKESCFQKDLQSPPHHQLVLQD